MIDEPRATPRRPRLSDSRRAPIALGVDMCLRSPSMPDEIASWNRALEILVRATLRIEAEEAAQEATPE